MGFVVEDFIDGGPGATAQPAHEGVVAEFVAEVLVGLLWGVIHIWSIIKRVVLRAISRLFWGVSWHFKLLLGRLIRDLSLNVADSYKLYKLTLPVQTIEMNSDVKYSRKSNKKVYRDSGKIRRLKSIKFDGYCWLKNSHFLFLMNANLWTASSKDFQLVIN